MDGIQEKVQSFVQGTTAKEISHILDDAAEAAGQRVGEAIAGIFNSKKERTEKAEHKERNSKKLGSQLSETTEELRDAVRSAIALPVKSAKLTVDLIKLTNEFVKAKNDELLDDIKSKIGEFKDRAVSAFISIKQFMFDRSKGKVNIKEEVSGNRAEQARKFIDLLRTPQGEKAPHDFYNVEIKSEGVSLLEVKDGVMTANNVAAQMDSKIIEQLLNQNTIPAVLNPSLSNIPVESLTSHVISQQQTEIVINDLIGEEPMNAEVNVNSETEAIEQADPIAAKREQLENLVKLHSLAYNRNNDLHIDDDKGRIVIKASPNDIGSGNKYTIVDSGSGDSASFITDKDGSVITYDANIDRFDAVLDSADLGFNSDAGSKLRPSNMSRTKELKAFNNLSAELKNLEEGERSIEIGGRTYQIEKTKEATTILTGKDSKLTIAADGKIASTGDAIQDLFAGGSKSNSAKLVAKIQDENNEVKQMMSLQRGAANEGDTQAAIGFGKAAMVESSELQTVVGRVQSAPAVAGTIEIPSIVSPEAVRETQESGVFVAAAVKQEQMSPRAAALASLSLEAATGQDEAKSSKITNPHLQELSASDLAKATIEATEDRLAEEQAQQM
jgi:hypothetical protein